MSSWLQTIGSPVHHRASIRWLQIRADYFALAGTEGAAKLLYWLELQTRYRIADAAEREGIEAAEALKRDSMLGVANERLWISRSFRELREQDFFGTVSRNRLRGDRDRLIELGVMEYREGLRQTNVPGQFLLVVPVLQSQLHQLGYSDPPMTVKPAAESQIRGPGSISTLPGSDLPQAGSERDQGGSDQPQAGSSQPQVQGSASTWAGSDSTQTSVQTAPPIDRERTLQDLQKEGENATVLPLAASKIRRIQLPPGLAGKVDVPDSLLGIDLEALPTPDASYAEAVRCVRRWAVGEQPGVLLLGPTCRGKTTLAAAATTAVFAAGRDGKVSRVDWVHAPSLPGRLSASFSSTEYTEVTELLNRRGGLVVDELCALEGDRAPDRLSAAITSRIETGARLLVTSELAPRELVPVLGERLVSHLVRYCEVVELEGPNLVLGEVA